MPPLHPPPTLDDRYALLERIGAARDCTVYRGRDVRLHRDVTVALLGDDEDDAREAFVEATRRVARSGAVEAYDASPRYLVTRELVAADALDLAEELAPAWAPSAERVGGWGPAFAGELSAFADDSSSSRPWGGSRLERTQPAVGLAAVSALLLVLTGIITAPHDRRAATEDVPAVMGVFSVQTDLRLLAAAPAPRARASAPRRAVAATLERPGGVAAEATDAAPVPTIAPTPVPAGEPAAVAEPAPAIEVTAPPAPPELEVAPPAVSAAEDDGPIPPRLPATPDDAPAAGTEDDRDR